MTRKPQPSPLPSPAKPGPVRIARWRSDVSLAVMVLLAHAGFICAAVIGTTTSRVVNVTLPAITGVLVSESPQELNTPIPTRQFKAEVRVRPKLEPTPTVQVPLTEHSVSVPEDTTPEPIARASAPAAPDLPASQPDSAPPVTPPLVDADYLRNPAPIYPVNSRRRREQGQVLLEVFIRADGRVGDIRVKQSSGHAALHQSAVDAVRRWNFVPAHRGVEAIPYWYELPIGFFLSR